jgi:hypothetical protein
MATRLRPTWTGPACSWSSEADRLTWNSAGRIAGGWWANQIEVAAIDVFGGCATAIGDALPTAWGYWPQAGPDVRDPTTAADAWANLDQRGWQRLCAGLAASDPEGEVAASLPEPQDENGGSPSLLYT